MKSRKCDTPPPSCNSPLLGIHSINEHGIVMVMNSGFDLGDALMLGFHLTHASSAHQNPDPSPSRLKNGNRTHTQGQHFISLEVIVIESKIGHSANGEPICLVTALFSQISRAALHQLLHYSRKHNCPPFPPAPLAARDGNLSHERFLRMVSEHIHLN